MNVISIEEFIALKGQELGTSEWFEISQELISQFADVTIDHQFIHIDEEKAKPIFGGTISHGFLVLSLLTHFSNTIKNMSMPKGATMGMNYGFDKVRFVNPVLRGSKVRSVVKLVDFVEKKPGQWLCTQEHTIEIEGQPKPALVCEWLTMYFIAG